MVAALTCLILGLTLQIEPSEPRQLLPTLLEVSETNGHVPRIEIMSARFGNRLGVPEEVTLETDGSGNYRGHHTFRGEGRHVIKVTAGDASLEREVTVAPQTWLSFGTEFGWFAAGVVVLGALAFWSAHVIRKRARASGTEAKGRSE